MEKLRLTLEETIADLENWLDESIIDDSVSDTTYKMVQLRIRDLKADLDKVQKAIILGN